jgi:hypothetical protein
LSIKTQNRYFAILPVVVAIAGLGLLPLPSRGVEAKPQEKRFEDLIALDFSGEVVSGTGTIDKGGFTVVTVQADKDRTKVCVSFTAKQQDRRTSSDFKLLGVDAAGKRYPAKEASSASAGGLDVMVITIVSEFSLESDKIAALVVQQTALPAKPPATPRADHVDLPKFSE